MSLQILFHGCGTRKDLVIKTVPYSKFSCVYLCDKLYRGGKRAFSEPGSRIMQLTGWAENKSQVHIYTACSGSAKLPRVTWE